MTSPRVRASTAAVCSAVRMPRRAWMRCSSAWRISSALRCRATIAGASVDGALTLMEALDFACDEGFGVAGLAVALFHVGGGYLLQVVDVVDEDAFELVHRRIDVARDGNVDEEHGAIAAAMQESLSVLGAEDVVGRAGGADDDVGLAGCFVEILEWNDLRPSLETASAMRRARSWVRLVTRMVPAPCWTRWRAASSLILPAPTRKTVRPAESRRSCGPDPRRLKRWRREFEPMPVSERAFLAAAKALWRRCSSCPPTVPEALATEKASLTWPRICGSPTTMESRLAAMRKRWRTASWSRCW